MADRPAQNFATGSGPDIAQRIRHAIEANETTRIVLNESLATLGAAIELHLSQIDDHLQKIIASLEGR